MAINRNYRMTGKVLPAALATVGASVASGAPVVIGQIPGVTLKASDSSNQAPVALDGIFTLRAKGVDGSGNAAIAVGDILYHVAADAFKLSKKTTGVRFGYALEAVTSGTDNTTGIKVMVGY